MEEARRDINKANYPLVSIIIPVYNVQEYILRCIDSVSGQTYKNIEIFLVDDGSTDNSGKICDKYATLDKRIKVIHQKNQGQAVARNEAIKFITGEYITFIDSDDYVSELYVETLMELQEKYSADIAIVGIQYIYDSMPEINKENSKAEKEILFSKIDALNALNYTKGFGAMCWAKLYKKDLILNHPFPEGQIYEDLAIMYKIFFDCERIAYNSTKLYYWVQRKGSTMRSAFNKNQMSAIAATCAQISFVEENIPEVTLSAKARHVAKIIELMPLGLESENCKATYKELRKRLSYSKEFLKNKNVKVSQKIRLISILLGYYPCKLIFTMHEKMKELSYR